MTGRSGRTSLTRRGWSLVPGFDFLVPFIENPPGTGFLVCPWLAIEVGPVWALTVPKLHPVQAVAVVERVQLQGAHPRAPESSPLSLIRSSYLSRLTSMPSTTAPSILMVSCSRRL